jgi:hypothetical protein
MKQRTELRNEDFMNHNHSAERKSREDFSVNLRKKKRKEYANQNRKLKTLPNICESSELPSVLANEMKELKGEDIEALNFIDICKLLAYTNHLDPLLEYLNSIINKEPQLSRMFIDLKMLETLVFLVSPDKNSSTLRYAVLLICNIIANNENTSKIFSEIDLIPRLLSVIDPKDTRLTENILWCFANFASESEKAAQALIDDSVFEIVERMEKDFRKTVSPSLADSLGYFLSNISKFTIVLEVIKARKIVNMCKFYIHKFEGGSCKNFILALNNLAQVDEFLEIINEENLIKVVIELIHIPLLRNAVLKFVKHVSSGDNKYSFVLINFEILEIFHILIDSEDPKISESVLFTLSNLACVPELNEILVSHEILIQIFKKISSKTVEVQQEASFFMKTFLSVSKNEVKVKALNLNLLSVLEEGLQSMDQVVLKNMMISVYHVLVFFAEYDFVLKPEVLVNVISRLSDLVSSKFEEISQLAVELLSAFNLN